MIQKLRFHAQSVRAKVVDKTNCESLIDINKIL